MLFMFCFGFKLDVCSCAGKLSTLKLDLTEPQRIIYCFDYLSKDRGGTHTHTQCFDCVVFVSTCRGCVVCSLFNSGHILCLPV